MPAPKHVPTANRPEQKELDPESQVVLAVLDKLADKPGTLAKLANPERRHAKDLQEFRDGLKKLAASSIGIKAFKQVAPHLKHGEVHGAKLLSFSLANTSAGSFQIWICLGVADWRAQELRPKIKLKLVQDGPNHVNGFGQKETLPPGLVSLACASRLREAGVTLRTVEEALEAVASAGIVRDPRAAPNDRYPLCLTAERCIKHGPATLSPLVTVIISARNRVDMTTE